MLHLKVRPETILELSICFCSVLGRAKLFSAALWTFLIATSSLGSSWRFESFAYRKASIDWIHRGSDDHSRRPTRENYRWIRATCAAERDRPARRAGGPRCPAPALAPGARLVGRTPRGWGDCIAPLALLLINALPLPFTAPRTQWRASGEWAGRSTPVPAPDGLPS